LLRFCSPSVQREGAKEALEFTGGIVALVAAGTGKINAMPIQHHHTPIVHTIGFSGELKRGKVRITTFKIEFTFGNELPIREAFQEAVFLRCQSG
jgi:hypothetical protein